MKLVKWICESCVNDYAEKHGFYYAWFDGDDKHWRDEGIVYCPHHPKRKDKAGGDWGFQTVVCESPDGCIYLTEHVVSQEQEDL